MQVLITGGGFLASHLLNQLLTMPSTEARSLTRAQCDLAGDRAKLLARLNDFRPALILHLAGRIHGAESELFRDNDLATAVLLDAVRQQCPEARVVLASTTAVYGCSGSAENPLSEDHTVIPRGDYARSKHAAERHAHAHTQAGGWIVIARISNPVGPGMSPELLCGTLARQLVDIERALTKPALFLRDLSPRRDFLPVRDCVAALWHLAQFGTAGQTYNVANGASTSAAEIVQIFLALAKVKPIEVHSASPAGERSPLKDQWVSHTRLRALGWEPRESVQGAISALLEAERGRI